MGFLDLLVEELPFRQVHLLAPEIFDPEAHSAELNGIELLDFVVEFAFRILQRAHNEPKPVDRLLLRVWISVLNVEALWSKSNAEAPA